MTKNHLKRLAIPKTWPLQRRTTVYITRPNPGPHKFALSMPLSVVMRELLRVVKTRKEAKMIIRNQEVRIDGRKVTDIRRPVGIMDVLSLPQGASYRCVLDTRGKLNFIEIDKKEQKLKMSRIIGKKKHQNNTFQITLSDGRNMLLDKAPYAVGDTLLYSIPEGEIKEHLPLQKGTLVLLVGGKHAGSTGLIEDITQKKVLFKDSSDNVIETLKKYVFVVGKEKPAYAITSKQDE